MKRLSIFLVILVSLIGCQRKENNLSQNVLPIMDNWLTNQLQQYYPASIDSVNGGYYCGFNYDWSRSEYQTKRMVAEARHLWTTATAARFFPGQRQQFLDYAARGFDYLDNQLWDSENGGYYIGIPTPNDADTTYLQMKQSYGNAFGIYALASYYESTNNPRVLEAAQRAYWWTENHFKDVKNGGYFELTDRAGNPFTQSWNHYPFPQYKNQNSHIHLLEAYTELYKVWPSLSMKKSLVDLFHLVRDTMVGSKGYLTLYFYPDWRPVSYRDSLPGIKKKYRELDHVSFGHDIETAYLLYEAADVLNMRNDSATLSAIKHLADNALKNGWDPKTGGLCEMGQISASGQLTITNRTKPWWVEAEGMNTSLLMAKLFPRERDRYEKQFNQFFQYIQKEIIDHQYGGWYQKGIDISPEARKLPKADMWKAGYHSSRAMMNSLTFLRQSSHPEHE